MSSKAEVVHLQRTARVCLSEYKEGLGIHDKLPVRETSTIDSTYGVVRLLSANQLLLLKLQQELSEVQTKLETILEHVKEPAKNDPKIAELTEKFSNLGGLGKRLSELTQEMSKIPAVKEQKQPEFGWSRNQVSMPWLYKPTKK